MLEVGRIDVALRTDEAARRREGLGQTTRAYDRIARQIAQQAQDAARGQGEPVSAW